MDTETYSQITDAITARSSWETRQSTWYQTRYTGIRRSQKPYPNAPDTHYPLVDTIIEKLRPFYAQQLYSDLVVATFVCDNSLAREQIVNVEQWYDYQIKQKSNFERSMMQTIDYMLQCGFCPLKIYWDATKKQVAYDPCDPLFIIVPEWTEEDPDWLVHVKKMSKAQYKANKKIYEKQSEEFIQSILGTGLEGSTGVGGTKEQTRYTREGITYSTDKDKVIIWEVYTKDDDGKWEVEEFAPVAGVENGVVRAAMGLPYKHGMLPFVVFRADNSQKGWYSSRGVSEILALHELALNKNWNSQLQYLDQTGHPVFKNSGLTPINPGNFQCKPGAILPQGVDYATAPQVPVDFQQQMQFVRALAEDRIVVPDLSSGEHLVGPKSYSGRQTATQVNAIVALSNQSNDMRSRMFRLDLGKTHNMSFQLLRQFAGKDISFIFENSTNQLDRQLLSPDYNYSIVPSGSADSWNKQQRITDAIQLYQLVKGDPNINQLELDKWLFEAKDPRLVNRLVQESGMQAMKQAEKQAIETSVMMQGRSMSTDPSDDDVAHLQDMIQTYQGKMTQGQMPPPQINDNMFMHAGQHVNQLKSKKHPEANQYAKQLAQMAKMFIQNGMLSPQAAPGAPSQTPMGPQGEQGKVNESISINYKDAPPSIRRQMEARAGMQPATLAETAMEADQIINKNVPKGAPAQKPQQPQLPGPQGMNQGGEVQSRGRSTNVHAPAITVQMPEMKPPIVNVKPADVHVHPTPVTVRPPDVHVHPTPSAPVNVQSPSVTPRVHVKVPRVKKVRLIKDSSGNTTGAEVEHEE